MLSLPWRIATCNGNLKMSDAANARPKQVRCPQCGGLSVYSTQNLSRPFCSERCKLLDLGAWATDQYAVPGSSLETPMAGSDGNSPAADKQLLQ